MVRYKKWIFPLLAFVMLSCATGYRYYTLDVPGWQGTLRGPTEKEDITLEACKPTEADHAPCLVMLSGDFFKLKRDLLDAQERLKSCEEGK